MSPQSKKAKATVLDADLLCSGAIPALTPHAGGNMAEAYSVCLNDHAHPSPTPLKVDGDFNANFGLSRLETTPQMDRAHRDRVRAAEDGAYGIAILAIRQVTPFDVIEQSKRGGGFDWWLGDGDDSTLPFHRKARLEVSGIHTGTPAEINRRVKQKTQQVQASSNTKLAGYVAVVEYSRPLARIVKR